MGEHRIFLAIYCFFTVLFCFMTLGQFMLFLSTQNSLRYPVLGYFERDKEKPPSSYDSKKIKPINLFLNIGLILIFGLQHSLQAKKVFKDFLVEIKLDVYERLLYNCASSLSLQILMYFWKPLNYPTLWSVSTDNNALMWWLFTIAHTLSWISMYCGYLIMDISELLGIKQVYHHIRNWPHPSLQKSCELLRLYSHMRHPGFTALVIILYIHPVMNFDRWLIANCLTLYMIFGYKVDKFDYVYQKRMLNRKYKSLTANS